jgi:dienelactone hydrolase
VAQIVLFHHAQGLRDDVLAWADSLREAGHEVTTPDLFEGRTFEQLDAGIAHRDQIGVPALMGRAGEKLEGLPAELVYMGFSMGASTAHYFALTRPGARAVLLMHGTAPAASLGETAWLAGLPGQLHKKEADPLMEEGGVEAAEQAARAVGASLELFTYPGEGHLFVDPVGPDYDRDAAERMLERELALLARL